MPKLGSTTSAVTIKSEELQALMDALDANENPEVIKKVKTSRYAIFTIRTVLAAVLVIFALYTAIGTFVKLAYQMPSRAVTATVDDDGRLFYTYGDVHWVEPSHYGVDVTDIPEGDSLVAMLDEKGELYAVMYRDTLNVHRNKSIAYMAAVLSGSVILAVVMIMMEHAMWGRHWHSYVAWYRGPQDEVYVLK